MRASVRLAYEASIELNQIFPGLIPISKACAKRASAIEDDAEFYTFLTGWASNFLVFHTCYSKLGNETSRDKFIWAFRIMANILVSDESILKEGNYKHASAANLKIKWFISVIQSINEVQFFRPMKKNHVTIAKNLLKTLSREKFNPFLFYENAAEIILSDISHSSDMATVLEKFSNGTNGKADIDFMAKALNDMIVFSNFFSKKHVGNKMFPFQTEGLAHLLSLLTIPKSVVADKYNLFRKNTKTRKNEIQLNAEKLMTILLFPFEYASNHDQLQMKVRRAKLSAKQGSASLDIKTGIYNNLKNIRRKI